MSRETALKVLEIESQAILDLRERIDEGFDRAVDTPLACAGRVVVTGMGKSGFIGQKVSATFASTGTPSLFLHPAEAIHGDLGRIVKGDAVLAISHSGDTECFTVEDFAVLHPGGHIGKELMRVEDLMHTGERVPRVAPDTAMKDVLFEMTRKRLGLTMTPSPVLIGRRELATRPSTSWRPTRSPRSWSWTSAAAARASCISTICGRRR